MSPDQIATSSPGCYAGLGRSLIYRLIREEKIQTVKIGGRRLVLRESLDALLHGKEAS
jgi:excisionase family DNA binding protein